MTKQNLHKGTFLHLFEGVVQTHVILAILRVCWGGSVLQLLTPDPVNPLNLLMNSNLCENHMFLR